MVFMDHVAISLLDGTSVGVGVGIGGVLIDAFRFFM